MSRNVMWVEICLGAILHRLTTPKLGAHLKGAFWPRVVGLRIAPLNSGTLPLGLSSTPLMQNLRYDVIMVCVYNTESACKPVGLYTVSNIDLMLQCFCDGVGVLHGMVKNISRASI